jgi:hypothetical protein
MIALSDAGFKRAAARLAPPGNVKMPWGNTE